MKEIFSRSLQTTIIFFVVGGILALALGGFFSSTSDWFGNSLVSIQEWVSTRYIVVRDLVSAPSDVVSLQQRNAQLESEISGLQTQVIQLQQQLTDTQVLAALVDFSQTNPESVYKAASVIGRDPSPFLHYIIINVGSNDGVRSGMPVVTNQGLIGRVSAVIADAARVQLVTDPSAAVNVRLQNADTDAVLIGSVTGDLGLEMISQDIEVQDGDVVLTSGLGGDYPPDLLVGQLLNLRKRDYELFQQASVQSTVDFSRLEIVLVIMNFKPVDITPLIPETTP
ncbi:MAG: rod shape-determining protein MreC [Anaerolineae bacterium]|jgi:rod shape-determining protein MreC|nr:rod shape-determining protein MreC [Anaerolineae bacterium]MBT7070233.1 rod shape-determining protein MreC [Anaerolineae bacterium]MBT7324964.1 rod shape-determining protein MreC [Anaerolineae bacterium]